MSDIVVPFNGLHGKRRLRALPRPLREALMIAMLEDVLDVCAEVGRVHLVTSDRAGRLVAKQRGVAIVEDPGGGQGAAVAAALSRVDGPALVVNSDLASAGTGDIDALLAETPANGLAVAPAPDGTTNALGLSASALFAPLYGAGSAARFRAHGGSLGVDVVDVARPGLAYDVDTPEDVHRLLRTSGTRSWAAVAQPA